MDEEWEEEGDDVAPRPQVPELTPPQHMSHKVFSTRRKIKGHAVIIDQESVSVERVGETPLLFTSPSCS